MAEPDSKLRKFYETSNVTTYAISGCLKPDTNSREYVECLLLDKLTFVTRHYRGGPVLDLCCATGQNLLALAPEIESGTGLDFSTRYVEAAVKRSKEIGIKNVTFIQGNAKKMPFKSGHFGLVYCFSSLYAIPQVEMAIAEISRILRPNGIAVLDLGNARSLSAYCSRYYTEWASIYPITRRAMQNHLSLHGLNIMERHCYQILPLWADRPRWLKPLLHPVWKSLLSRRFHGKMLDEWISSFPGLRSFAFRHLLICVKSDSKAH